MISSQSIGVLIVSAVYHPNRGDDIARLTNRDIFPAAVLSSGLTDKSGCAIEAVT